MVVTASRLMAGVILLAGIVLAVPVAATTGSVSLGSEFASGTYGAGTRTGSVYSPLTVSWYPDDRLDLTLEVPMLYQSNTGVRTALFRNGRTVPAGIQAASAVSGGGGQGGGGAGGPATQKKPMSAVIGLGDITLRLGAIVFPEGGAVPQVRSTCFIKFPVASVSDELGTGEFDAGAGIELVKWFGPLHLTGEGGYTYQGKAPGLGLKDFLSYSGAVGYQVTKRLEPMVVMKGASAPTDSSGGLLEARVRLVWAVTDTVTLDLYGASGIAGSSPDYGVGVSAGYSF